MCYMIPKDDAPAGTAPGVFISVTAEKWEKTKSELRRLRTAFDVATAPDGDGQLSTKLLDSVAGFLNHVSGAVRVLRPYVLGIYHTANAWRPD